MLLLFFYHLTFVAYFYSPSYRPQSPHSIFFCVCAGFVYFAASLYLPCFSFIIIRNVSMFGKLLYLLHAAFSLFERAEGMSVQPVIVQLVLLNKYQSSISKQWCQRSGEVKGHCFDLQQWVAHVNVFYPQSHKSLRAGQNQPSLRNRDRGQGQPLDFRRLFW